MSNNLRHPLYRNNYICALNIVFYYIRVSLKCLGYITARVFLLNFMKCQKTFLVLLESVKVICCYFLSFIARLCDTFNSTCTTFIRFYNVDTITVCVRSEATVDFLFDLPLPIPFTLNTQFPSIIFDMNDRVFYL